MKNILIIAMILSTCFASAQNRKIIFEDATLSGSLIKAKKENKLVFVDCYTEWCGPCKAMAANVFTVDSVADFFNTHFVNVQLNMEKGEGKANQLKYHIEAYPSFLLLSGDGEVVYKFVGAMSASEFMEKIKEGTDPSNRIRLMNKMYADGNRSKAFLRDYIPVKLHMMEKTEGKKIAEDYFNMLSPEERILPENWFLFGENRFSMYLSDVHSRNFNYLANNWRQFVVKNGRDVVEARMSNMYRKITEYCFHGWYFEDYLHHVYPYNEAEFDHYRKQIRSTEISDKEQLIKLMDIAQAVGEKDTVKVSTLLASSFSQFSIDNQRCAATYFTFAYRSKKSPEFQKVADQIILTAKDERLAKLAKNYKK